MLVDETASVLSRWAKYCFPVKTAPGTSFFRHYLLGQARVERFLIDLVQEEGT